MNDMVKRALTSLATVGAIAAGVGIAVSSGSGVRAQPGPAAATTTGDGSEVVAATAAPPLTAEAPLLEAGPLAHFTAMTDLPAVADARVAERFANSPKERFRAATDGQRRAWVVREVDGVAYLAVAIGDTRLCLATVSVASAQMGGMACSSMARATKSGIVGVQTSKARSWAYMIVPDDVVTVGLTDADGKPVEAAVVGNFAMVETPNAARSFTLTTRDGTTAETLLPPPLD
jgi:hypothetical protein